MDAFLRQARLKQKELVLFLQDLVECESPSDNPPAIERFQRLFESKVGRLGRCRLIRGTGGAGPHLQCEFKLGAGRREGQILALGHADTVYPLGTLPRMPFRRAKGRLWGPGVLDMKAGIAFFVFAMKILGEMNVPVRRRVLLQLNSDEEVGSDSSRSLTEAEARRSIAVLVLEPGTGLEGKVKTARKGIGGYTLRVQGVAAHAGVDFPAGANAIVELARQVERVSSFTDLRRGTTVNPGVIQGGTRSNVVPESAWCEVDMRVASERDAAALDRKFRSLRVADRRCRLEVEGGLNRPPMERSKGIIGLFQHARSLAGELGVELQESSTGGGSDGNFTAALGIPTLDGIGAVGEGAHSSGESILVDRIADRVALLAKLVASL